MSTLSLQARLRRLEKLIRIVLAGQDGPLFHVRQLRKRTGKPVVVSVTHYGNCLSIKAFTLVPNLQPELLQEINPRKVHQLLPGDSLTHWLSIDDKGQLFMIDPPALTELPLVANPALTMFHPLTDEFTSIPEEEFEAVEEEFTASVRNLAIA